MGMGRLGDRDREGDRWGISIIRKETWRERESVHWIGGRERESECGRFEKDDERDIYKIATLGLFQTKLHY